MSHPRGAYNPKALKTFTQTSHLVRCFLRQSNTNVTPGALPLKVESYTNVTPGALLLEVESYTNVTPGAPLLKMSITAHRSTMKSARSPYSECGVHPQLSLSSINNPAAHLPAELLIDSSSGRAGTTTWSRRDTAASVRSGR
eukprot:108547-Prorocentrum_minimum.AAC.2